MEVAIQPSPRHVNSDKEAIRSTQNFLTNPDKFNQIQNQSSRDGAFLLHRETEAVNNAHSYQSKLADLIKDPLLNTILPDLSSMFSVVGNIAAATAHFFDLPEKARHYSDLFGVFGTKLFLFVNATINTMEQLTRNNYLSAFGYFLDNIIAAVIPQEHTFLARGLSSGTYHLAYSLGIANGGKAKFENLQDHNNHLKQALKKTAQNLFSKQLLPNFFKSSNAMSGVLGGIFSILGVAAWPVFGKKVATLLRDIGGSLKSTNYINPGHIREGRQLYFLSGIFQCGAAAADFVGSMFTKTRSYMVPVSLGLDGMAKYVLRQSNNKGEIGEV